MEALLECGMCYTGSERDAPREKGKYEINLIRELQNYKNVSTFAQITSFYCLCYLERQLPK